MSKNLTIKEQNLHAIVKDLMDKALAISRPNKEKICRFVVNLVENGGKKADAAMAAGYGSKKDENGNERSFDDRRNIASSEAYRLLKNDAIFAVYEALLSHRFLSNIFVNHLKKEHLASVFYQAGMIALEDCLNSGKKITPAIAALREAGILAGFYDESSRKDPNALDDKKEEVAQAAAIFAVLLDKTGKTIFDNERKRLN